MVTSNTVNRIYNTGEKSPIQIEKEFAVRQKEFHTIMEDIRSSTMEFPEQEYLIIGEKGMGKTMLLTKIKYEIESDEQLKNWLIPIAFPEELNGVSELYDLWLRVAEHLEESPHSECFKQLYQEIVKTKDEETAYAVLNQTLKNEGKKIILLIDNFGTFLDDLDRKEDHRLREILITNTNLRIVAAHPQTIQDVHRYDKAFYEHFIEIKLKGLSREDTKKLMLRLGEIYGGEKEIGEIIKNEPYRIEALRNLTGGNIRNVVMLFNILLTDKNQDPLSDLIQILDDITPLNTGKIAQLKKNQKKIIHYIALQWDAIHTADIAKALRMKSNEVSAQLNHLADNQWIISKGKGRKKMYQLRDRFFNIWYLMRYDRRSEKTRVKWLVHFYKIMCRPSQLADIGKQIIFRLNSDICSPQNILTLAIAHLQTDVSDENKIELYQQVSAYLQKASVELVSKLPPIIDFISDQNNLNLNEPFQVLEYANNSLSDKIINTITQNTDNLKQFLDENKILRDPAEAYHILGHEYYKERNGDWEEAFKKSIGIGHKKAAFCLAACYHKENDYKNAEKYYKVAMRAGINLAYFNYAQLNYMEFKNYDKTERLLLDLIKKTKKNPDADALDLLAHLYSEELGNAKKATIYFKKAIVAGKTKSRNCLAWHYYSHEIVSKKEYALKLVKEAHEKLGDIYIEVNLAIIYLWNGLIEDSIHTAEKFLFEEDTIEKYSSKVLHYLVRLLCEGQVNYIYNYFDKNEHLHLKDRFKPLWYAIVYLLEGRHSEEYLKMGDELKETVKSILDEIEKIKNP